MATIKKQLLITYFSNSFYASGQKQVLCEMYIVLVITLKMKTILFAYRFKNL